MKFMRNEEGFTGLEAAIVLIAFVVVAAVFSYVMLGAGFFTSQKSQEVVHTSVAQASSSVEVVGNVVGNAAAEGAASLVTVDFTIATTAGGNGFDLNTTVITYRDATTYKTLTAPTFTNGKIPVASMGVATAGNWKVKSIYNKQETGEADVLVENGEQVVLSVGIPADASANPNAEISIELKPAVGAPLLIKKTVPPQIDIVNLLY